MKKIKISLDDHTIKKLEVMFNKWIELTREEFINEKENKS
jgi:hypothetical protein